MDLAKNGNGHGWNKWMEERVEGTGALGRITSRIENGTTDWFQNSNGRLNSKPIQLDRVDILSTRIRSYIRSSPFREHARSNGVEIIT